MKFVMVSAGAPERQHTIKWIGEVLRPQDEFHVVVHTDEQATSIYDCMSKHFKRSRNNEYRLHITGMKGLLNQRNYVLESIVPWGEWYVGMDDNIQRMEFVHSMVEDQYGDGVVPVMSKDAVPYPFESWRDAYRAERTPREIRQVLRDLMRECEGHGTIYGGFASTENPMFRQRRRSYFRFVKSKLFVMKNITGLEWGGGDYAHDSWMSAYVVAHFGRVVVNNFAHPRHKMYESGGLGSDRRAKLDPLLEDIVAEFPGLVTCAKGENSALRFVKVTQKALISGVNCKGSPSKANATPTRKVSSMLTISVNNVNEALPVALGMLRTYGKPVSPRGAQTLEVPFPVSTTYWKPQQRILFDPDRDANPFFHFFEAFWIIAGRKDVGSLSFFLPRISEFSDDGVEYHGAYGWRLRNHLGFDQIEKAIELISASPDTRRAVLQIWDAQDDLGANSKDIPCNDMVFLKVRNDELNITVCNRSNDVIWGAYGANVVQFSMLQEYIACRLGLKCGRYTQISDSFHVYLDNPYWQMVEKGPRRDINDPYAHGFYDLGPGASGQWHPVVAYPLFPENDWGAYGLERFLETFYSGFEHGNGLPSSEVSYYRDSMNVLTVTEFFLPMYRAYLAWKQGRRYDDAYRALEAMPLNCDWAWAARHWLRRREANQKAQKEQGQ